MLQPNAHTQRTATTTAEAPRFPLGDLYASAGAMDALVKAGTNAIEFLLRHVRGDWGDLNADEQRKNELSVEGGCRLLSVYELSTRAKIWIITEADRSATQIMLPSEY